MSGKKKKQIKSPTQPCLKGASAVLYFSASEGRKGDYYMFQIRQRFRKDGKEIAKRKNRIVCL